MKIHRYTNRSRRTVELIAENPTDESVLTILEKEMKLHGSPVVLTAFSCLNSSLRQLRDMQKQMERELNSIDAKGVEHERELKEHEAVL